MDDAGALEVLRRAIEIACADDKDLIVRRKKRKDVIDKIKAVAKGELPQFGDEEATNEASKQGKHHKILGKNLVSAIREAAQEKTLTGVNTFGKMVPKGINCEIAGDLEVILRSQA